MSPVRFYPTKFQGGLDALAQGAMHGAEIGIRTQENEKDRVLRRAALDIAQANQKLDADAAGRQATLQDAALKRKEETDVAARGIADMAVGGGMQGPLADPEEERARQIVPLLNAETVPLFMEEYQRRQVHKMLADQKERHLSQWSDLANDPELAALSPRQQEEAAKRAEEATALLGEIEDPDQLEEALKLSAKGLTETRTLIGKRVQAAEEKARIVGFYQPELAEMQASLRGLPPDIAAEMQERINILSTGLAGYQAGAITPTQLQAFWYNAKAGMRPDGTRGRGKGEDTRAPWERARELVEADVKNGLIEGVKADGSLVRWEEATADERETARRRRLAEYERQYGGGEQPAAPPAAGAPTEQAAAPQGGTSMPREPAPSAIPFTKVKAPDRARLVAAFRAAVLRGARSDEIDAIVEEFGVDMATLPEVVKRQILAPSPEQRENDKKDNARRDKLEKIGTNF